MLLVVCLSSALGGAIVAAAGVVVGYRLGRKAAITHEGIRQAGEVRNRIVSAALPDEITEPVPFILRVQKPAKPS